MSLGRASFLRFAACAIAFLITASAPLRAQCASWSTEFAELGAKSTGQSERLWAMTRWHAPAASNDELYVAGRLFNVGGASVGHVARWNGVAWSSLGSPSLSGTWVRALASYDDGSGSALYAGGLLTGAGSVSVSNIARWNGTIWSALGSGVNGEVRAFHVHDDGSGSKLYVAGRFTVAGGVTVNRIARWDGTTWSALGSGANDDVYALATHDDGTGPALYAAGRFTSIGGVTAPCIARWNGSAWSAVSSGMTSASGTPFVSALATYNDGGGSQLYAGGDFQSAGGTAALRIARWNGTSWSALGAGIGNIQSPRVNVLRVFNDGSGSKLYVIGHYQSAGTLATNDIATWSASGWAAVGNGMHLGEINAAIDLDDGRGPALFTGGFNCMNGGVLVGARIARWDGLRWTAMGSALQDTVRALASFDDGSCGKAVYAAGDFATCGASFPQIGHVARWTGSGWELLGASGVDGPANALVAHDDGSGSALYVGGSFAYAVSASTPAANVARWSVANGWSGVGGGTNGEVRALTTCNLGTGAQLYAAGSFTIAGGIGANRVASWDGTAWKALGSGVGSTAVDSVSALTSYDPGAGPQLYVGGSFATAGGLARSNIAAWDGTNWNKLGAGTNGAVLALTVFDDGSGDALYAAGQFSVADGVSANNIARWDGTGWTPLGSGTNGAVRGLATFDDGTGSALYAVGDFTSAGGIACTRIARWDGTSWSAVASGVDGSVLCCLSFRGCPSSVASLFVGGSFSTTGGVAAANVGAWVACASATGTPYCFGDGTGRTCPCACQNGCLGAGCRNSTGDAGRLFADGVASLAADTLTLRVHGLPATASVVFVQGVATAGSLGLGQGLFNSDGLVCVTGSPVRFGSQTAVAGTAMFGAGAGTASVSVTGMVGSASTRYYTAFYRNSATFCTSDVINFSNGLAVTWLP